MKRDNDLKQQRAVYVQEYINSYAGPTTRAVEELKSRLFVSEATIYRDLTCTIDLKGNKTCI
jgi:DeoR/GlpR family transcriptional regulator of sugar metabolism